jgi:hypothetical protein
MQSDHSVAALADDGGQATYDIPRLGTDRHRAEALGQARVAVERAVERVGDALVVLGHRGKKAKEEGGTKLRELQADLAALDKCLRKAR